MPQLIALITCTKSKAPYPAPARLLYSRSALFRKALAYVESYADHVCILSAKYGLISLDQHLEPYEQTINNMPMQERRAWAERVFQQIQERLGPDLSQFTFEFHTGIEYRRHLAPLLTQAGAACSCQPNS